MPAASGPQLQHYWCFCFRRDNRIVRQGPGRNSGRIRHELAIQRTSTSTLKTPCERLPGQTTACLSSTPCPETNVAVGAYLMSFSYWTRTGMHVTGISPGAQRMLSRIRRIPGLQRLANQYDRTVVTIVTRTFLLLWHRARAKAAPAPPFRADATLANHFYTSLA